MRWIDKKYLAPGIFLLALALRLIYLAEISDTPYFDTLVLDAEEYDYLSDELLRGNWLLDEKSAYVHGPFYTFVLALFKLGGAGFPAIRVLQAILGALSCVLVYRIAGALLPHPVPLIAGLLAAGYWPFIFYDGEILATTLVLFLELALAAHLLGRAGSLSRRTAAIAGILLGLLIMTRSNTLLLGPVLLWWIYQRAGGTARHRVSLMLVFSLVLVLALAPFLARNYAVQNTLLPFQGSWSLYLGNNPEADGTPYARQGLSWQRLESRPFAAGDTTPAARGRFFRTESLSFALEHPLDYLGLFYRKFRLFWHAFENPVSADLHYMADHSLLRRVLVVNFGVAVPLALAGMVWAWRQYRKFSLLYGFILVYLATGLMFTVCARYRLPALPFLLIFAAQGIAQLAGWVRSRDIPRAGGFLALVAAAALLVHTGVDAAQVNHLRSSWLLGQVHFRNQRYDQAEQTYLNALQESPGDSDVLNSLASVYLRQGRTREAEATYRRAVEVAPDHARPWLNLANFYLKRRQLDEAESAAQKALESDPRPRTQHEGYYTLGYVYLFRQDYPGAYQAFTRALAAMERSRAYYALANAGARLGLIEEQIHALEQAVRLEPTLAPAHRNLGALYLEKGEYEAAKKALQQAIAHEPDSPVAYQHLGALYLRLGQQERARQAFEKARQLASRRPESGAGAPP